MFKKRNALKFVLLCLLFTATAIVSLGCDDSDNDPAPTRGEISIQSLTPGNNALIAKGDTITASLSYSIKDMDPDKKYVVTIWIKKTNGYGTILTELVELTESSGVVEHSHAIGDEFDDPELCKAI